MTRSMGVRRWVSSRALCNGKTCTATPCRSFAAITTTKGTESRPGMKGPVHLPQVLPIHVRVDLRRRDVDVPKHLLYRPEIGTPLEQVRGERVPQRMRRHVLREPRALHVPAQDLP